MQAARILSQEQRHTLESVYTFIKGATIYLEAHRDIVRAEDSQQITNLLNFGELCQSRLVEQFAEIAEWERRGGAA